MKLEVISNETLANDFSYCTTHGAYIYLGFVNMRTSEEKRQYELDTYYYYKEHGICVRCHKQPAFHKHVHCPDCIEKVNEYKAKHLGECRKNNKKWYDKQLTVGKCVKCGGVKDSEHKTCSACRAKARNQYWKNRYKRRKCTDEEVLELKRKAAAKMREARTEETVKKCTAKFREIIAGECKLAEAKRRCGNEQSRA